MTKQIKTIKEALQYLESENIGVHKGYTLNVNGMMYPVKLDTTRDLIKWCNQDREDNLK